MGGTTESKRRSGRRVPDMPSGALPERAGAEVLLWFTGALLLGLLFLVPGLHLFVWLAPVPWLVATERAGRAWKSMFGAGVLFVAVGCLWILEVGLSLWVCNAVWFGLQIGAALWLVSAARRRWGTPLYLLAPPFLLGAEVVRLWITPIPTTWLDLGYLLVSFSRLRQCAELGWVFAPGLLILVVAGALAEALLGVVRKGRGGLLAPRVLWGLGTGVALLGLAWGYGAWRLEEARLERGPVVALVQPAIAQEVRNDPGRRVEVVHSTVDLTLSAALGGARLVVWPETAVSAALDGDPELRTYLAGVTARMGRSLLLGAFGEARRSDGDPAPTNSAYLLTVEGVVGARWDKRQLVPPSETLLWLDDWAWARRHLGGFLRSRFAFYPFMLAGDRPVVHLVPEWDRRLGVTICYGDVLPGLSRDLQAAGADVIAVLSNEAWFGASEKSQHLAMARMRAVEVRRPVIRATNDGITAILDETGDARAVLAPNRRGVLVDRIPRMGLEPPPAWVPYSFSGGLLLIGSLLSGMLAAGAVRDRRARS